jgi:hypothetical protein
VPFKLGHGIPNIQSHHNTLLSYSIFGIVNGLVCTAIQHAYIHFGHFSAFPGKTSKAIWLKEHAVLAARG